MLADAGGPGVTCVPIISALRRCRLEDQKFLILSCMPRSRLVWDIEDTISNLTTRQKEKEKLTLTPLKPLIQILVWDVCGNDISIESWVLLHCCESLRAPPTRMSGIINQGPQEGLKAEV